MGVFLREYAMFFRRHRLPEFYRLAGPRKVRGEEVAGQSLNRTFGGLATRLFRRNQFRLYWLFVMPVTSDQLTPLTIWEMVAELAP